MGKSLYLCLTGLEKKLWQLVRALNFLKVLWTGHENLEKFQLNFPDPVISINNERSLRTGVFSKCLKSGERAFHPFLFIPLM